MTVLFMPLSSLSSPLCTSSPPDSEKRGCSMARAPGACLRLGTTAKRLARGSDRSVTHHSWRACRGRGVGGQLRC